ncbi:hypothetical protein AVEN_97121-1 [Araneus ventricosus]|uniref:Uncharacterized protein n=1 Tax=Araneus ventricosus TaxID=182803 RepID=A0A4Y2V4N8_ARAVE|nr:hypothetical protein AVEN_97121-1 [Araneus ventricosus]
MILIYCLVSAVSTVPVILRFSEFNFIIYNINDVMRPLTLQECECGYVPKVARPEGNRGGISFLRIRSMGTGDSLEFGAVCERGSEFYLSLKDKASSIVGKRYA